jgi:hypothetical protein
LQRFSPFWILFKPFILLLFFHCNFSSFLAVLTDTENDEKKVEFCVPVLRR